MLPVNTLVFSGYGDSGTFRFADPSTGTDLGQPDSAPDTGAGGCAGLATMDDGSLWFVGGDFGGGAWGHQTYAPATLAFRAASIAPVGGASTGAAADGVGNAYYLVYSGSTQTHIVRTDADGLNPVDLWTITNPVSGFPLREIAVNQAGTVAYLCDRHVVAGQTTTVLRVDLTTGVATTFVTNVATLAGNSVLAMLCLGDDTLVVGWSDRMTTGAPVRYQTDGSVLNTYTSLVGTIYVSGYSVATEIAHAYTTGAGVCAIDTSRFYIGYYHYGTTTYSGMSVSTVDVATGTVSDTFTPEDGTFDFDGPFTALRRVVDPTCYGGGEITVVADPADGEVFSGRTLAPRAWLTLAFDDEDRSFALDRYNHLPAYYGGPKLGHLLQFGSIRRQLSDRSSPYKMADVSVEVDDSSRLLSTLEDTAASQHWQNREGRIYLASPETIADAGTPHVLFRGIWRGHQSRGLQRTLQLTDVLGSEFSDLNLERAIPSELIGESFTNATDETKAQVVPIALGKWVDTAGQTGDPVENVQATAVPPTLAAPSGVTATWGAGGALYDAGDFRNIADDVTLYYAVTAVVAGVESLPAYVSVTSTAADGSVALASSAYSGATAFRVYVSYRSDFLQFAQLTTDQAGSTLSLTDKTGGTRTDVNELDIWSMGLRMNVDYFVWAKLAGGVLSQPGQSTSSPAVMFTPVSFARDRVATVTWDAYTDAVGYVVVRRRDYYNGWGREYDARWELGASTTSLTDTMTGAVDVVTVPNVPTGCLPLIDVGYRETIDGTVYRGLLLCKGAIQHVEQIYTSRALIGVGAYSPTDAEAFELVPESAYGSTWLAPGKTGWPHATNYVEINDRWYTIIYTTREPLPVSIRVNACTRTDVSDGTGSVITGAPRGIFHLLTQEVLPPEGEVWTAGDYLDPREFDDGTPVINSSSFAAAETVEVARLAAAETAAQTYDDGYQIQLYLDQPITIRELLSRLQTSFDLRFGQNAHGQLIVVHLDEFTDLSGCRHVTDAQEIQIGTAIDRRLSELENRIVYDWGWRPAADAFDYPGAVIEDDVAIAANRGRAAASDKLAFLCTRDAATVTSVAGWRLGFGKYPPRYVTLSGPLHWISATDGSPSEPAIKLGDIILVTDVEGVGATGYDEQPCWVVGIEVLLNDLETAPRVVLTCIDVSRFLGAYGLWAGDAIPNWASASAEERATYLYWSTDDDEMSDGSEAKRWS